jgi:hypothetical protein
MSKRTQCGGRQNKRALDEVSGSPPHDAPGFLQNKANSQPAAISHPEPEYWPSRSSRKYQTNPITDSIAPDRQLARNTEQTQFGGRHNKAKTFGLPEAARRSAWTWVPPQIQMRDFTK